MSYLLLVFLFALNLAAFAFADGWHYYVIANIYMAAMIIVAEIRESRP